MNRRQLLFRRALRNNQSTLEVPRAIQLTERPVSSMDTVAKIEAIGLIPSEIEAAAKGMRYGMTYKGLHADFFYHISAASFSTNTVWSITFEHTRWEDNDGTPIQALQSVYITVSRADENVSVYSYEISQP